MVLIAPPEMRRNFNITAIANNPALNIQAGLALLHLKLAYFTHRSPFDDQVNAWSREAVPKSLFPDTLADWRPDSWPFDEPSAKQPKIHKYISGWIPFCPVTLYQRYNIGDGAYARKLEYCMELIGK